MLATTGRCDVRLCEGEEDTYNFLPQAPLGAVSSAAEESEGKLMAELMSGAAFILKLNNIRAEVSTFSPEVGGSCRLRK